MVIKDDHIVNDFWLNTWETRKNVFVCMQCLKFGLSVQILCQWERANQKRNGHGELNGIDYVVSKNAWHP